MYIVLLSGGSGKRLWPLSNDLCSKQYIKLMNHDVSPHVDTQEKCSMLQRVFGQLKTAGLAENTIVCASSAQEELIESQLDGAAEVAVEPMRRDTFPAVMLSCAYLLSKKGAKEEDVVAFLPVDPYTTGEFFSCIKRLGSYIEKEEDAIGLLGGVPTYPSTKYGYILPQKGEGELLKVKGFREKPDEEAAQKLVSEGALWNCGVFCFKLSMAAKWLGKYGVRTDYNQVVADYEKLPKTSFDYEVLEGWDKIVAVQYDDIWKDLGTWNTLTEEMKESSIGDVTWDETCENSHAVNVLGIPMVVMGAKNMVIAASHDGILIADKHQSSYIKDCLSDIGDISKYEERRWGTIKTIDNDEDDGMKSVTKRVKVVAGKTMPEHKHFKHTETITVLSGMGKLMMEGVEVDLIAGATVSIAAGKTHAIQAIGSDLRMIEVSIGDTEDDEILIQV
ncbi:MAG: sugar phosphate nucleotidyltransferase [Roseburia sp.]